MMGAHPDDAVLLSFVLGDLSQGEAISVALHLDGCPHCAARAAGLDPLTHAFAAVEDPALPEGLVESILERDAVEPVRDGKTHDLRQEPLVAVALMAASTLLFLALGQPAEVMASVVSTAQLAGSVLMVKKVETVTVGPNDNDKAS